MDIKYTDQQIAELITERKLLPDDWRIQLNRSTGIKTFLGGENDVGQNNRKRLY